jgi:hypothetical protein
MLWLVTAGHSDWYQYYFKIFSVSANIFSHDITATMLPGTENTSAANFKYMLLKTF